MDRDDLGKMGSVLGGSGIVIEGRNHQIGVNHGPCLPFFPELYTVGSTYMDVHSRFAHAARPLCSVVYVFRILYAEADDLDKSLAFRF
jgi:hypothetical protein